MIRCDERMRCVDCAMVIIIPCAKCNKFIVLYMIECAKHNEMCWKWTLCWTKGLCCSWTWTNWAEPDGEHRSYLSDFPRDADGPQNAMMSDQQSLKEPTQEVGCSKAVKEAAESGPVHRPAVLSIHLQNTTALIVII